MNQDQDIWMRVGGSDKTEQQIASLRQLTLILYILYASCWILGGLPAIVAIVINYIKREDAAGTLYESHFAWQIRSFWWGWPGRWWARSRPSSGLAFLFWVRSSFG